VTRFDANCTFLFKEFDLLERPAAAKRSGFDAIEIRWPFETATPETSEMDAIIAAVRNSGTELISLNLFAGDLDGPDCGIVSWPGRETEFRSAVSNAVALGEQVGTIMFNALYGNAIPGVEPEAQAATARENLAFASRAAEGIGATILIEPMSGPKPYPLRTASDVLSVVDDVRMAGSSNIAMLFDIFHLANNGEDVPAAIGAAAGRIGHVQIADFPERGEPGSGELPIASFLTAIESTGYDGWVGLEYNPTGGDTEASLGWLPLGARSRKGGTMQESTVR
jgi:hydroxypyruvate isomerase